MSEKVVLQLIPGWTVQGLWSSAGLPISGEAGSGQKCCAFFGYNGRLPEHHFDAARHGWAVVPPRIISTGEFQGWATAWNAADHERCVLQAQKRKILKPGAACQVLRPKGIS